MDAKLKNPRPGLGRTTGTPFFLALIVLGATVAFIRILTNGFVFDDFLHIINRPEVVEAYDAPTLIFGRELTYGLWRSVYLVFGLNPLPFHLLSLAAHIGTSILLFFLIKQMLPGLPRLAPQKDSHAMIAGMGAVLFAVHPLNSEAVAYAAQLSIQLVTFFSLLALFSLLRWSANGKPIWLLGLLVSSLCACLSKQPGFFHLAINLVLVAAVLQPGPRDRFIWWWKNVPRTARLAVFAAVVLTAFFLSDYWVNRLLSREDGFHTIFAYWLTQSRVFFEYLWRFILPLGLSADHLVPWSTSARDTLAVVAFAAILISIPVILWKIFRSRSPLFLLAGLVSAHLLIRFLYPVDEIMVEYRTYPSMPWVALTLSLLLFHLASRLRLPQVVNRTAYASLLVILVAITHVRTKTWSDELTLTESILKEYPLNLRAHCYRLNQLQTLGRHEEVLAAKTLPDLVVHERRRWDKEHESAGRGYSRTKTYSFHLRSYAPIARSLSALGQHEEALAIADQLVAQVYRPDDERPNWTYLYLRARVRLEAGKPDEALEDLALIRRSYRLDQFTPGYRAEIEKMTARARSGSNGG